MDDLVDYEEYARSLPQDETLVSIPEGGTYNSISEYSASKEFIAKLSSVIPLWILMEMEDKHSLGLLSLQPTPIMEMDSFAQAAAYLPLTFTPSNN